MINTIQRDLVEQGFPLALDADFLQIENNRSFHVLVTARLALRAQASNFYGLVVYLETTFSGLPGYSLVDS